jgi:hypothetical protein
MPVELRKRKAHQLPAATPEPKKSTNGKVKKVVDKVKKAVKPTKEKEAAEEPKAEEDEKEDKVAAPEEIKEPAAAPAAGKTKAKAGDVITLEGFGGEIETNDGKKTTLKELVDESKAGVVLFTYPKASTPGCKSWPQLTFARLCHVQHCARKAVSLCLFFWNMLLTITISFYRHYPSLPLPRLLRASHRRRPRHLRS